MENKRPRDRIRQRALGCRLKKVGAVQCSACVRPPADTAAVCGAAPCAYVLPAPTQRERRGGRGRAAWPRLALPRLRPSSPSPSQPRARARAVPSETVARGCPREPARPLCAARPLWLCPPPRRAPCDTAAGRAGGARVRGTDRGGRHQAESEAGGGHRPASRAHTNARHDRPTDRLRAHVTSDAFSLSGAAPPQCHGMWRLLPADGER